MPTTIAPPPNSEINRAAEVWRSIGKFSKWLEQNGFHSYDPYDLWGTPFGLFSRRLYYEKRKIALPLVAPFVGLEFAYPQIRALFLSKTRYAMADAQLGLAFLNLFRSTEDISYLTKAEELDPVLLQSSIPGYSGHCWGYPFDWQNAQGLWRKNTPFITATPYCFEFFVELFEATGNAKYLEIARSIAEFVFKDLRDTPTSATAAAGSYSPNDSTLAINASAYRAMLLMEASIRFHRPDYAKTAAANLNFVLESQNPDGSWLYSFDEGEKFIDHFHTCFVLKNLCKYARRSPDPRIAAAIERGFAFYRRALFDAEGLPIPFVLKPRMQLVRRNLYDIAECINLGVMLRDQIPGAWAMAEKVAHKLCAEWQLPDGHFVTYIYIGGLRHTMPYLRWPQSQLFYALTTLYRATGNAAM